MENQNKPDGEPHVQIFGRDVERNDSNCCGNGDRHRRHRRGGWVFGLILIFTGAVLLLNNMGVLPWSVWNFIWPLWPLLLVLIGLRIVFGRGWAGDLIVFIAALAILVLVLINALNRVNSPLIQYFPGQMPNLNFQNNQIQ